MHNDCEIAPRFGLMSHVSSWFRSRKLPAMELSKFFEGNVTLLFDRLQDRIGSKNSHSTPNSPVRHSACPVPGPTSPRLIARQVPRGLQGGQASGNGQPFFFHARTTPNSPVRSPRLAASSLGAKTGGSRPRDQFALNHKVLRSDC